MEWISDVMKLILLFLSLFQFNNGVVVIRRIFTLLGNDAVK